MANKRISALDNLGATPAVGDILPITDIDDPTGSPQGTTKGVTFSDLTNHLATQVSLGNHELLTSAVHGISAFGATLVDDADAATARTTLGLGTASTQDVGTVDGNVVQLSNVGGTVKLPAVDGSQLTNVSGTDSTKLAIASNLSDLNDAATARTNLGLGTAATTASTDYATTAQGALADTAVQPTDGIETLSNVSISNPADGSILKYVSANSQYEEASLGTASTANTSDFATSAQGLLADTAVQPAGIANMVETTDSIDVLADVDTSTVSPTDGQALVWDNTAGQWEPGPAGASTLDDLSDVTITSAQTEDVIKFNGTSFVNGQVSVDVDTPLNTALRGTDNPHIGAYPNQSFKVIDNPYQSVMVVADEAGNLKLLNSLGANNIAVGFSVVEDSTEPDIEVVSGSETYSVISGDSDSKGANGLPIRQGFNLPDIGANPAPILISGGSIA